MAVRAYGGAAEFFSLVLFDLVRGNLHNPARITWSVSLFLKYANSGYVPPDLYDRYPYYVVEEFSFLCEEYPKILAQAQASDQAIKDHPNAGRSTVA